MRYLKWCFALLVLSFASLLSLSAHAGIMLSGTRVVYPAQQREVSIKLTNDDAQFPRLVQAWIDTGDEKLSAEKSNVPFILTPPVFRVESGKSQVMRMVYTKEPLATDKETLFWLNVLEVPPRVGGEEDNQLRFAFRLRTKIFFRPANLAIKPDNAPGLLEWRLVKADGGQALQVRNPTPYYISFQSVALAVGDKQIKSDDYTMVEPGGVQHYSLKNAPAAPGPGAHVAFSIVDDYGAFVPLTAPLAEQ
ncbi:fimbrial biogenesis chaperone [Herbaspirillum autotrophicum]|uniref:fimbrial biogenesis chaperone n=1 Tax=Herbaspirillum autotrophicum TaxID=180195 RepID=UPI00067AAD69|nr:molecular chaperone [Herbaspirillum autotrophicum]